MTAVLFFECFPCAIGGIWQSVMVLKAGKQKKKLAGWLVTLIKGSYYCRCVSMSGDGYGDVWSY